MSQSIYQPLFKSFFLAGFECATGYNQHGHWIDQIRATQHDQFADLDYRLLSEVGIRAARDAVRWPLVDQQGKYDFSSVEPIIDAGQRHGVEVVWDLFHYGYPDDVDLFSPMFPRRFADYCYAAARWIAARTSGTCYFTPVNEPSYFAWAAGDAGRFAPHQTGRSQELKQALIRAAIQGIEAIWAACPGARIVNADPVCRMVAPHAGKHRRRLAEEAYHFNQNVVFESWDMLCGRIHPELGGSRKHLDIVGINYYFTCQWEIGYPDRPLSESDPRWWPLRKLVRQVWERYGGDLLVSETSHCGDLRPFWLRQLGDECEAMLREGVPLQGACIYPVHGMPKWHEPHEWERMGLWDLIPQSPTLGRIPFEPALQALREAQRVEGIRLELQGRSPIQNTRPTPHGFSDPSVLPEATVNRGRDQREPFPGRPSETASVPSAPDVSGVVPAGFAVGA